MSTKQGVTKYCEGCAAKIPAGLKQCPCCGIDKPYQHKYGSGGNHIFSATGKQAYSPASDFTNTIPKSFWKESQSKSSRLSSKRDSRIPSSGKPVRIPELDENVLYKACYAYSKHAFQRAYDLSSSSNGSFWDFSVVSAVSALRLIQDHAYVADFRSLELAIVKSVELIESTSFPEKKYVQAVLAQSAIHSAMIFVINRLGSDVVKQTEIANGECNIFLSERHKQDLRRLMAYTRVLQSIYEIESRENLSMTILFLASLVIKLEQVASVGISKTKYTALEALHGSKCKNSVFKRRALSAWRIQRLSFRMYPNEITNGFPLNRLGLRKIAYTLE